MEVRNFIYYDRRHMLFFFHSLLCIVLPCATLSDLLFSKRNSRRAFLTIIQASNQALVAPAKAAQAANSKPQDFKPRLLLMGLRRSGKSSIASVVFHKMPPNETLFLESTTRIQKDSIQ